MTNHRPFKFRVWNKKLNRWVSKLEIAEIKDGSVNNGLVGILAYTEETDPESQLAKDCVIQQFTGLTDKSGREIYEGDIVDYRYDGMSEFEAERYGDLLISPVFWDYERWRIKYSAASYAWHLMKVVGNIYENPELLKPCSKN